MESSILSHNQEKFTKKCNNYGYKSSKFPEKVPCEALEGFENELWTLIKGVKLQKLHDSH